MILFAGCGLGTGRPPWETNGNTDAGLGPGDLGTPTAPVLDYGSISQSVCADEAAIVGRAQGNAMIIARGGDGGTFNANAQGDGSFCVPVRLSPNQVNTFEVRAHNGNFSEPATVSITHNCAGHQGTGDPLSSGAVYNQTSSTTSDPTNVGQGAPVTAKYPPSNGTLAALTDGDPNTVVEFETGYHLNPGCIFSGWDGWVKITLPEFREIERIVIRWRDHAYDSTVDGPNQDAYAAAYGWQYRVYASTTAEPTDPNPMDGKWSEVRVVTDGKGGTESLSLGAPIVAKHIAILLELDGWCGEFSLRNFFRLSWWDSFVLGEVELYGTASGSPTNPQPTTSNVCSRGQAAVF